MPITVICGCGKQLSAPDAAAGKKAKCPGCGQILLVPAATGLAAPPAPAVPVLAEAAPAAEQKQACPHCGESILAVAKKCRHCGEWLEQGKRSSQARAPISVNPVWVIPFLLLVTLGIYWVFWLHRVFKELHARGLTEVDPGTAVGWLFVPGYNVYWLYAVFAELQKAITRAYEFHRQPMPPTGLVWVMPVVWLPASIVSAFTAGAGIPFSLGAASLTLCFVQSWMNKLAGFEAAGNDA